MGAVFLLARYEPVAATEVQPARGLAARSPVVADIPAVFVALPAIAATIARLAGVVAPVG
ncbi:hypothetical protein D3C78_1881970 [compost metagenome]